MLANLMSKRYAWKNGYLIVLPWGLHHIGGVNHAVLDLRSQVYRDSGLRPIVLISEYGHDKTEKNGTNEEFREYCLTLRQPMSEARSLKSIISYFVRFPRTIIQLLRIINDENISAINVHYPDLSALVFVLITKVLKRNTQLVLSFHGSDVGCIENSTNRDNWLWNVLLSQADHIVTCSNALASRLAAAVPESRKMIKTVHNGVDQYRLKYLANKGKMPEVLKGKKFILNVATLEWKKGQDTLIKSFSQLTSSFPELLLVIMGRK